MKFRIVKKGKHHFEVQQKGWFGWWTWTDGDPYGSSTLVYSSTEAAEDAIKEQVQRRAPIIVKEIRL